MIKRIPLIGLVFLSLLSLGGCSNVGSKTATMSVIYIATSVLALLLLLAYCTLIKKREPWFILLFSAVAVVNIGYLSLSISSDLQEALLSNRISYLGSVFLPLSMLMTILRTCKVKINKWLAGILVGVSVLVFLIAASPGYLDIYYKEVILVTVGGATTLEKVYGPLHGIYLYYLLGHFAAMTAIIIYARAKKKINSGYQAIILLSAVFINIGVWLMEQLVKIDFEFLSVSYIVSEVFLLGVGLLVQDINLLAPKNPKEAPAARVSTSPTTVTTDNALQEKAEYLSSVLYTLTPTEKSIYNLYLEGKRTKDVMSELSITENTLKYHNRNIYSKLGVSGRKELVEVSMMLTQPANT